MDTKQTKRTSKFLSLVLRHQPEKIGLELDEAGWVNIETLLQAMAGSGNSISRDELEHVVTSNDKQRFTISEDGAMLRAKQGHSVSVDLGYQTAQPPELLCHGTPQKFVQAIQSGGLKKMNRHHVHMHPDKSLAKEVGSRRGKPVLLMIRSGEMHRFGFEFFVTENEVWLTDHVPPEFIDFPNDPAIN